MNNLSREQSYKPLLICQAPFLLFLAKMLKVLETTALPQENLGLFHFQSGARALTRKAAVVALTNLGFGQNSSL
jgi:hypothetical protein